MDGEIQPDNFAKTTTYNSRLHSTGASVAMRSSRSLDEESASGKPAGGKPRVLDRLHHFTWPWFACTMSTGSLAVVLSQQPYAFAGLQTIGKIFFVLDLVLIVCFIGAIEYRFIHDPSKLYRSIHKPREALFFGSFWVSLALILICAQQYGVPASGPWLVRALGVLFWVYAACATVVAIFQYSTLFVEERVTVAEFMPAWIFPIYPLLLVGPLAGVLIPSQPPKAALAIFVGGIMFQGLGWFVSIFMYAIYIIRLMSSELPNAPIRPGMFVSVGPAGYTSAAFVSLGMRAPGIVPQTFPGVNNFDVGAFLQVIGVLAGVFLWLLSFWFFALSVVAVISGARAMRFTLNWWAFIFPNAGMTLAAIQIGDALQSPGIKAVTSAMTILLVLAWFLVAACHIYAVASKAILWEGQDEDVDTDGHER